MKWKILGKTMLNILIVMGIGAVVGLLLIYAFWPTAVLALISIIALEYYRLKSDKK